MCLVLAASVSLTASPAAPYCCCLPLQAHPAALLLLLLLVTHQRLSAAPQKQPVDQLLL
jgi:hypothetical protein